MSVLRTIAQAIPGGFPGIVFFIWFVSAAPAATLDLAVDLFAEEDWPAARRESLRVAGQDGPAREQDQARLLAAVSALRLDRNSDTAQADLTALWRSPETEMECRSMAAYEAGRAAWTAGVVDAAFEPLQFAYLHSHQPSLFWRAGASLYFLMKPDRGLQEPYASLWQSLQTCRDAWPLTVWQECRPPEKQGTSIGSLPGKWIVSFYRSQISPAIGARCDLLPSCSEYFRQASAAHGLLGIPIQADRFVREPSVVKAGKNPVVMPDGHIRYPDPLSDHDFWMKGNAP